MIRACTKHDFDSMLILINTAAEAYRAFIPSSQWKNPYMKDNELATDISFGIQFSGFESDGVLKGLMGVQTSYDVTLVRHAYVYPSSQRCGIGSALLSHCQKSVNGSILIGTWAGATWAIRFYEKHGFRKVSQSAAVRLLHDYWNVPQSQIAASVVLANPKWFE